MAISSKVCSKIRTCLRFYFVCCNICFNFQNMKNICFFFHIPWAWTTLEEYLIFKILMKIVLFIFNLKTAFFAKKSPKMAIVDNTEAAPDHSSLCFFSAVFSSQRSSVQSKVFKSQWVILPRLIYHRLYRFIHITLNIFNLYYIISIIYSHLPRFYSRLRSFNPMFLWCEINQITRV